MTKRRSHRVAPAISDDDNHVVQLFKLVDEQHRLLLDLAMGRLSRDVVGPQFAALAGEFRAAAASVGKFAPAFPFINLEPWVWEAASLPDETAIDDRLRDYRSRFDAAISVLTNVKPWRLVFFADDQASFAGDLRDLDGPKLDALEAALDEVLAVQGRALIGTKWIRSIANVPGLWEFRVDNDEGQIRARTGTTDPNGDDDGIEVDVLVRAFFAFDGKEVILLLSTYDKGEDASDTRQRREIREAAARLKRHRQP
jgi:hypothetical protein